MQYITFNNKLTTVAQLDLSAPLTLKNIPQTYRYSAEKVPELESDLLTEFLLTCLNDNLKHEHFDYKYSCLDTHVHMLKPSWLPCISGWHCDDFYRDPISGQPLLNDIDAACPQKHYICVIGETSFPEFITEPLTLPIDGGHVYKSLNTELNNYLRQNLDKPVAQRLTSGLIVRVGPSAIHRGVEATKAGWRAFLRLTLSNHRFPKNEIRTQTQVYLTNNHGW